VGVGTPSTGSVAPRKGWKDHFLKSGVPLEYEVAGMLPKAGMSVDADFPFLRRDVAGAKEFSVDIASTWYGPTKNDVGFELQTLIECKYRSPEKVLLLLEDPNEESSSAILGGTVSSFDTFTPFSLPQNAFVAMEKELQFAYKFIEIFDGGAIEEEIRHGIQQLRYASPARLRQIFDFSLLIDAADPMGIFFTKILVTNAPLRLLDRSANIEKIKTAAKLDDVSKPIDMAILFSDFGPDFEDHVRSTFESGADRRLEFAQRVKRRLVGKKFEFASDPVWLVNDFWNGGRWTCSHIGTQFFVTNLNALPKLIDLLKSACKKAYRSRNKVSK
jgi:hypothetical protein